MIKVKDFQCSIFIILPEFTEQDFWFVDSFTQLTKGTASEVKVVLYQKSHIKISQYKQWHFIDHLPLAITVLTSLGGKSWYEYSEFQAVYTCRKSLKPCLYCQSSVQSTCNKNMHNALIFNNKWSMCNHYAALTKLIWNYR